MVVVQGLNCRIFPDQIQPVSPGAGRWMPKTPVEPGFGEDASRVGGSWIPESSEAYILLPLLHQPRDFLISPDTFLWVGLCEDRLAAGGHKRLRKST